MRHSPAYLFAQSSAPIGHPRISAKRIALNAAGVSGAVAFDLFLSDASALSVASAAIVAFIATVWALASLHPE